MIIPGSLETVHSSNVLIDGKKPGIPDDLDIGKDGFIYWSDASTTTSLSNSFVEYLGQPSGRLIKYEPKANISTVLIDGLHFANGVQLSKNEDFVIVCETMRSRVWRLIYFRY
jgi:sugar lactone lactonase YvrE